MKTFPPSGIGAVASGLVVRHLTEILRQKGEHVREEGADRLFLAGVSPTDVEAIVGQAVAAGIGRIVLLSSHGARHEAAYGRACWHHLLVEQAVEASGVEWTHLRSPGLMSGTLRWATAIRDSAVVRAPYAQAAYPLLDDADLAEIAATVLLEPGHHGRAYNLAGAPGVSQVEQVKAIAAAIGQPIRFEELSPQRARDEWEGAGWPEAAIQLQLKVLKDLVDGHTGIEDAMPVEELLGRPAGNYADWVVRNSDGFRRQNLW
ncbi:hypothetical protein GCM10009765_10620 [Fodinicola feengrottensis]|uniref:NAD(P)H-binding protein n=2 Tax=Fodinicola feengrottensis TaxID=435914 RepID=A0ABP4RW62_9ACTN